MSEFQQLRSLYNYENVTCTTWGVSLPAKLKSAIIVQLT